MKWRALSFAPLLTTAAACAVGPDYRLPEIPVFRVWEEAPSATVAAADGQLLERWWTVFQDSILDRFVARAVEGNLDLKIVAVRIREVRVARGIAASAGLL
jgi:outer membrane protein TolC